jgi:DNA invertase Pin-like site-specific DNA recombinase
MRLVGYVRVSTAGQAKDGLGLEVQERAIKAWAKKNHHKLITVERDEGVSGANGIDTRVGIHNALELIRSKKAHGVVVYRLDRLARDLILQEQLLADIRRANGEVFSTMAGEQQYLTDDPDDPSRKLIRQVLGAVAEYEKAMIRQRLWAGRIRKAGRGQFALGSPPFGWRAPRSPDERRAGVLVPKADEQDVISYMAHLREKHKRSLREVAEILNAEGIPARGGRWHKQTVQRALLRLSRAP